MWTLLLSRVDDPHTYIDRRQIDGGQIKIGRAIDKCDWVIPDHDGYVSREHCTIVANGLDLFVVDTSSFGTMLNDPAAPIAPRQPIAIRVNDRLILGDFVIEIAPEGAMAGAALAPAPPPPLPGGGGIGGDQWFEPAADPIWNTGSRDLDVHEFLGGSFDDFMAGPAPTPRRDTGEAFGAVGMGAAFSKPIMAPMNAGAVDFGIPEDWDLGIAAPAPPPAAAPSFAPPPASFATPPPPPDSLSGGSTGGGTPDSDPFAAKSFSHDPFSDDPFPADPLSTGPAWDGGMPPQVVGHDFEAPPPVEPAPGGEDPFADFFEDSSQEPAPPASQVAPPVFQPAPAPTPAVESAAPVARPVSTGGEGSGGGADWDAFCEGAGIDPADLRRSPDAMRRLGVLYRQVVLGLSDLIQDRAAFKSEFRLGVTTLAVGRNNPLKMLGPLDTAKVMLDDPLPGFMPSDEAVRSAFEDIKKHQMAMLAGVQHALTAVFKRLSPSEIEKLLEKATAERRGSPFRRNVDPWTVYQTVFEALRTDATSNANSVMSVAFREGYEEFLKSDPARS